MGSVEELKADFKRVYIEQWGIDGWNKAIVDGSLPKWLHYTKEDCIASNNSEKSKEAKP